MENFNKLTPAEDERLSLLVEECSEVIQAAMKIQRHGYESTNNGSMTTTNRNILEKELGHVMNAMRMMFEKYDVSELNTRHHELDKRNKIAQYLHHQWD